MPKKKSAFRLHSLNLNVLSNELNSGKVSVTFLRLRIRLKFPKA